MLLWIEMLRNLFLERMLKKRCLSRMVRRKSGIQNTKKSLTGKRRTWMILRKGRKKMGVKMMEARTTWW
jgi:hypothetical protein